MDKLILFIALLLCHNKVFAYGLSSTDIENKALYFKSINAEDSLIYYYKLAKKNNIITNKLPIVVGDFYYERQFYARALNYFEAAFYNDKYNIDVHQKLYACYSYLGMLDQQRHLTHYFLSSEKKSYRVKNSKLDYISFYAGSLLSNVYQKTKNLDLNSTYNVFGSIDRTGSLNFLYLSAQYSINSRFSVMASINQNTIHGNQQMQFRDSIGAYKFPKPKPGEFPRPDSTLFIQRDTTFNYKVSQPILYTQFSYILNSNFKLKFTYGLTQTKFVLVDTEPKKVFDDKFERKTTNNIESTIGFIAEFRKPKYSITTRFYVMPFSKSNFLPLVMQSDSDRTQFDLGLTYYPLQKYRLSLKAQASLLNTQNSRVKYVYNYEVNWNIYKKLWMNVSFVHNNLKNYIDVEGAVVYNIDDIIKNKYAVKLIYYFGKRIECSLQYGQVNRVGEYSYIKREGAPIILNNISYKNQLINGGIKWSF